MARADDTDLLEWDRVKADEEDAEGESQQGLVNRRCSWQVMGAGGGEWSACCLSSLAGQVL